MLGIYNFEQHQERQQHRKRTHKKRSQDGEKVAPSIIMTSINVPTMDPSLHVVHNGVPSIKDPEDPEAQLSREPKSWIWSDLVVVFPSVSVICYACLSVQSSKLLEVYSNVFL